MGTTIASDKYITADIALSPAFEYALHELSTSPDGVGVPADFFHQTTAEALDEIIPPPVEPRRMRRRAERQKKIYVKASGCGIVKGCLDLAIQPDRLANAYIRVAAVQQELPFYETKDGRYLAGLAILAIKSLADLAKKVGMSYAQTQQIVTLLIILGFMKRFRSGRKFLYAIPLGPYAPDPTPEVVRDELAALLQKLDLEEPSASKSAQEKRARFRRLVETVKLRYEIRYNLMPNLDLTLDLQRDPACLEALREIRAVLPAGVRASAMPEITRIIAKRLSGRKNKGFYVDEQARVSIDQITKGKGSVVDGEEVGSQDEPFDACSSVRQVDVVDERSRSILPATTPARVKVKSKCGNTKRVVQHKADGYWEEDSSFKADELSGDEHVAHGSMETSLDGDQRLLKQSVVDDPFLGELWEEESAPAQHPNEVDEATLIEQSQVLAVALEEDWDITRDEHGKNIRVSWVEVEEYGKKVRRDCSDPDVKLLKAGCHKKTLMETADAQIAKAAFVYTLLLARKGGIKTTRPAFFTSMCRIWSEHGNYEAACEANKISWGQRTPKGQGIPKAVRTIMNLFGHCAYTDLVILLNECTQEELVRLIKDGVPPDFARATSSLADEQGACFEHNEWLQSLLVPSPQCQANTTMTYEVAQSLIVRIGIDMPTVQVVGMRDLGNRYTVQLSLRGRLWEIGSEEEWNHYIADLRYIRRMKEQLRQQK